MCGRCLPQPHWQRVKEPARKRDLRSRRELVSLCQSELLANSGPLGLAQRDISVSFFIQTSIRRLLPQFSLRQRQRRLQQLTLRPRPKQIDKCWLGLPPRPLSGLRPSCEIVLMRSSLFPRRSEQVCCENQIGLTHSTCFMRLEPFQFFVSFVSF